jgi:YVTN family beta-propeller protein
MVLVLLLTGAMTVQGLIPNDNDGDGVPNDVDQCPAENSAGFDRNGDGCIDAFVGARHIEYWGVDDATITYVINETAAPNISNGTDLTAVQNAFAAWTGQPNTDLNVVYGGTVTQANADALDGVNLVTFIDNGFSFSNLVLAVGLSTSFEADTTIAGRVYRKGEIFDADMLFNPTKTFKAGGSGPGTDIQSVATHEAGHMFGLAHSTVQSSTMFYALPGGFAARSLESDDELVYFKAYGDSVALAGAKRVQGTVTNGSTSNPVPGAIVFLIHSASGDTAACDYTLPDGTYSFPGVSDGSYRVAIHPLDGTSSIGFIQPGNINALVAATAETTFMPEWFDNGESNTDDPNAFDTVTISNGQPVATANIVTNVDATAPEVVFIRPGSGEPAVDGVYVIEFTEAIELGTIRNAFSLRNIETNEARGGNIALIRDDKQIVFTPSPPLEFETDYRLRIDTDLEDRAGNALAEDFVFSFTTEPEPPVSISSLAPNKGIVGTTVVITGRGFDAGTPPTVTFNGIPAPVIRGSVSSLVVEVPAGAETGAVTVTNADLAASNDLTFTVLSDAEFARGFESGQAILPAAPNAIALTPSGDYAYIAGVGGAHAVVASPALPGYLSSTPIPYPGELVDIATTAQGTRAYAVCATSNELVEINTDPTTGLLFNTILSSRDLGASPNGIVTNPTGTRAYIATDTGEIQAWDIQLGSVNYNEQVGVLHAPYGGFEGSLAVTPTGEQLLAVTDAGVVAFYDLTRDSLLTDVSVGSGAKGIVVDPAGERAYVAHDNGNITVMNIEGNPFVVQDIATGGSVRRLAVTPAARYLYATDRELDNLKIVDLDDRSPTFRSVVDNIEAASNPIDVALSPGGEYAFSVLQGGGGGNASPRMLVTTVGIGPALTAVSPLHAPVGAQVVLTGLDFGDESNFLDAVADFNGVIASTVAHDYDRLVVTVPTGATSGPVRVRNVMNGQPVQSNALFFEVFPYATFPGLRESVAITADGGDSYSGALIIRPQGDVCFVGTAEPGYVLAFDIRPGSTTFHQSIGRFLADPSAGINDLAVSRDGRALFIAAGLPHLNVMVMDADPNSPNFGALIQEFQPSEPGNGISLVEMSPDNKHLLVHDGVQLDTFDVTGAADGVAPVRRNTASGRHYMDLEFNPSGLACYLAESTTNSVEVLDMNPYSAIGTVMQIEPMPGTVPTETPMSLAVSPDGNTLYTRGLQAIGPITRSLYRSTINQPTGTIGGVVQFRTFSSGGARRGDRIVIGPRGGLAVHTEYGSNLQLLDLVDGHTVDQAGSALVLSTVDYDFEPSGTRVYYTDTVGEQLRVFELANPAVLFEISGDGQNGVAGQYLSSPLRCRIMDGLEFGFPVPGISVTLRVTAGGGLLKSGENLVNEVVVATDQDGYVEALWQLGTAGLPQQVQFIAEGLVGSPETFTATSAPAPEQLPLSLNEILPQDGATNVSATTAIVATFSRAIDPATIGSTSLFIEVDADATLVPVTYGFTDGNRRVSLTPSQPLSFMTQYRVQFGAGIETPTGESLSNAGSSVLQTGAPPALALRSITPPSALTGVNVTVAGTGFNANPAANTVSFNGTPATPIGGNTSQLVVRVPVGATSGLVTVTANATTSNALDFTVLVPNQSPIDEVIANVNAGSGVKSCAVTPDGALCYTVSPDGDVVTPVDVAGATAYPAITVGDQPVAIIIHPEGKLAYVANFNSSSVSVIDVDPASGTFNTVLTTITVGANPADLAVFPDGDRILVVNAGSGDLSVIDGDETSAAYHTVIANVSSGSGAKSVAVSPDGTRFYVGTNVGFLVVDAQGYGVIANVNSGSGAKSVAVSPDGTLLFILTTGGNILIVDVVPGSASENQVVANVGSGSGAKSVAVSPDGTLLYIVQENSDVVLVIAINVIPGVSAMDAAAPSFTVQWSVIDEITVGSDPAFVAVDPSGEKRRIFVPNAGDGTVSIVTAADVVAADIAIFPRTLYMNSEARWVLGEITLPLPHLSADILRSSIRLQGVVPIVPGFELLHDIDHDGVKTLVVAFDRPTFQATLPQGEYVPVTITGEAAGRSFAGVDTVRTLRPVITYPHSGEHLPPNTPITIRWTTPQGFEWLIGKADVHFSGDNGVTWTQLADKIPNTGQLDWTTPNQNLAQCRIMVTLYWKFGFDAVYGNEDDHDHDHDGYSVFGMGMNQDPFSISLPVAVRLKSASAAVVDGDAVLRWETSFESDMDGFRVVRAEAKEGLYTGVAPALIAAKGGPAGASYEYRDASIRPNRTYWYKLVEVTADGEGSQFGPYSVTFHLANRLEQNMPNPFNPVTTIKYSIAQPERVSLMVYDVSGRLVRTLVDDHQAADVYRVTWDGTNNQSQRVASGLYFYRLVAGKFIETRKMLLLK